VSVVMPSFNQAGFIDAAARSVLGQDGPPVELVVADGGSTDGTLGRLESLLAEFGPRLRWVSGPDAGPANAVNKALGLARGEVVGWLNSDDLYAPGAVAAAARHLAANPDEVMVYGEGEHIDGCGQSLGRYPTRPPAAGLNAFHDGCFICQPTAFLRRGVFEAVGGLDESLKAAFDFELWLRVFRRYPGRIAHIDRVQAFSRLHAACLTMRIRQTIAVEGVQVLARHVGPARPHWLLSYLEELYADYPFTGQVADLRAHMAELSRQLDGCFDGAGRRELAQALAEDARLRLALPGAFAGVYSDGWAPPALALRFADQARPGRVARLRCRHAWPVFAPLSLSVKTSWGVETAVRVGQPGPFELEIPLPPAAGNCLALVESDNAFVPRDVERDSADARRLAFKVESFELGPAA
jgi:hypothetical protein